MRKSATGMYRTSCTRAVAWCITDSSSFLTEYRTTPRRSPRFRWNKSWQQWNSFATQSHIRRKTMASSTSSPGLDTRPEDVLAHLPAASPTQYYKGQAVYGPDNPSKSIYLVVSGT